LTKSINPDVAAFKDDFFKGLSIRECIFGGAALVVGVGGTLLLHFYFGMNINAAITMCMPVIGIIGLCGFYHKNSMTLMEIIKSVIRLIRQKPFTYETRTIFNKEMEETTNERSKKSKQ
jgi:energy-converting hydrogenase Eha subunit H